MIRSYSNHPTSFLPTSAVFFIILLSRGDQDYKYLPGDYRSDHQEYQYSPLDYLNDYQDHQYPPGDSPSYSQDYKDTGPRGKHFCSNREFPCRSVSDCDACIINGVECGGGKGSKSSSLLQFLVANSNSSKAYGESL